LHTHFGLVMKKLSENVYSLVSLPLTIPQTVVNNIDFKNQ
jgi:hypothetical protein